MSPSHHCVTAQNQAEFPQNLEMCTPTLEKSHNFFFIICICFCMFLQLLCDFLVIFMHFPAQKVIKAKF